MGRILDGKEVSKKLRERLAARIKVLNEKGIKPALCTIIVGCDSSCRAYIKGQAEACRDTGLKFNLYELPEETQEEELIELIHDLNSREDIHGIMVQVPLPKHINQDRIARTICPEKDVDGFNPENSGRLFRGEKCLVPCTPKGVIRLLEEYKIDVEGKRVTVIGRSNIVGKPAGLLFLNRNATVVMCHSRTKNLEEELRSSDIIVSAIGKPGIVKGNMIKEGAVVVDVGTKVIDGHLKGDVNFEEALEMAAFVTPVPGGVGAMTTTMLIENVLEALEFYD